MPTPANAGQAPVHALPGLLEALPYLCGYLGKTVVLKVGGSLGDEGTLAEDIGWVRRLGVNLIVVHGGGPLITDLLKRLGQQTEFVDGRRYTDEATLDVVRMVLIGKVNSDLVAALSGQGVRAAGVSGLDERLLVARVRDERLGLVGEVTEVNPRPLSRLLDDGCVAVVAPVGCGPSGQSLNVNADTAAGAIAAAVHAEDFILFTDVPGLLDERGRLIETVWLEQIDRLKRSGVVQGGMIPKLEACAAALATVPRARITDGRVPHALLRELFSRQSLGTMVAKKAAD